MPEIDARFLKSQIRTEKVVSYQFAPEQKLDYLAGQFAQVIFDEKDRANKTLNKYLSFSCRPGKDYIEITKKLSESDFSLRLRALKPGDRVLLKAAMGHCVLSPSDQKVGFLIGGIGITPVISILEDLVTKQLPTDVVLLYSNWTPRDIAFKPELDAWSQQRKDLRVVHTVVECQPDDQHCFSGIITESFVRQQMPDYRERAIFIFGPPGMVSAMQDICGKLGCDQARVKAENFVGY